MMCVYGCRCVCMRYICIFASLFDSFFHVSALEHHCDLLRYIRINIIIIIYQCVGLMDVLGIDVNGI